MSLTGCGQQQLNSAGTKPVEISSTPNSSSPKELLTLEDVEKLFAKENINLVRNVVEQSDFNRLMQKLPAEYYVDGKKDQLLKLYVFNSQDERAKAKAIRRYQKPYKS